MLNSCHVPARSRLNHLSRLTVWSLLQIQPISNLLNQLNNLSKKRIHLLHAFQLVPVLPPCINSINFKNAAALRFCLLGRGLFKWIWTLLDILFAVTIVFWVKKCATAHFLIRMVWDGFTLNWLNVFFGPFFSLLSLPFSIQFNHFHNFIAPRKVAWKHTIVCSLFHEALKRMTWVVDCILEFENMHVLD